MADSFDPGSTGNEKEGRNSGPDDEQKLQDLDNFLAELKAQNESEEIEALKKKAAAVGEMSEAELKAQILAERAHIEDMKKLGLDVGAALRAEADAAWEIIEGIETEIQEAKDMARSRKDEISGWKLWYNSLAEIDKTEAMKKLEFEISWRSQEIKELEEKISRLGEDQLAARGRQERARQMRAAYEAGVYDRPMEEDPRLGAR